MVIPIMPLRLEPVDYPLQCLHIIKLLLIMLFNGFRISLAARLFLHIGQRVACDQNSNGAHDDDKVHKGVQQRYFPGDKACKGSELTCVEIGQHHHDREHRRPCQDSGTPGHHDAYDRQKENGVKGDRAE
ncbi:hypothetical protein SDC9_58565 [bioreactor metagenome]|uniref:Uncharacterized protein n=1 Tax=bioreactor metagenome TaxID=1076179 RepID=A0A644XDE7_9ZZZZ